MSGLFRGGSCGLIVINIKGGSLVGLLVEVGFGFLVL